MAPMDKSINNDETIINKIENIFASVFETLPQFLFSALNRTIGSKIRKTGNDKSIDIRKIYTALDPIINKNT